MDYTQLKIKYCPALFPDLDFEDRIYNYDTRLIVDPSADITVVKSEDFLNEVGQTNITNQVQIQSRYYNAFELVLYSKETTNYNVLRVGEQITLVDQSGYSYFVELISFDTEKINDTFNYKFTVKFKELATDNFTISNYCQSDWLLEKYEESELVRLELSPNISVYANTGYGNPNVSSTSTPYKFYTKVLPIMDRESVNVKSIILGNGMVINTNSQDYGVYKLRFWLSNLELNQFLKLVDRAFHYNVSGNADGETLFFSGGSYTSVRPLTYELKTDGLINLTQVDVKFYYENVNYNNFL